MHTVRFLLAHTCVSFLLSVVCRQLPPKVESFELTKQSGKGYNFNVSLFDNIQQALKEGRVVEVLLDDKDVSDLRRAAQGQVWVVGEEQDRKKQGVRVATIDNYQGEEVRLCMFVAILAQDFRRTDHAVM